MLPNQASFLAFALVMPAFLYVLYRSLAPYELIMGDLKLAGSILWPLLLGSFVGGAHLLLDPDLILTGAAPLAFLVLYPLVETYVLIVVFNRRFFMKQTVAAAYFAMGGAALAVPLGYMEGARTLARPELAWYDGGALATTFAIDVAFVLFHTSKGLFLGSIFVQGKRMQAALLATLLEMPLGLLYLAGLQLGPSVRLETLALMIAYALAVYYFVWHVYFPKRMPEDMRDQLVRSKKRPPGKPFVERRDGETRGQATSAERET